MENVRNVETSNTEMITISRAEYNGMVNQINWLTEQVRLLGKKAFGASSEKTTKEEMDGQVALAYTFNEAETYVELQKSETKETSVAGYTRVSKSSGVCATVPENIDKEIVVHGLPEDEQICPDCGGQLAEIGKESRYELVIIPAKVLLREHQYITYVCPTCKDEAEVTPVVKTPKEPAVIPGSNASPEAIAHIMTQKFVMGSPLYRQSKEWERAGIMLSRQTMSNWILRASNDWLSPIYDRLKEKLRKSEILHSDETTLQVLREDGKPAQSKSYMWLYRTSGDTEYPIVLYDYCSNRKAENVRRFLGDFSGYVHTDGYVVYHGLPENIKIVGCFAHARRKFDEAVAALPQKDQADSPAQIGQNYCSLLFAIEKSLAGATPEERYKQRLERAKPVLDALLSWSYTVHAAPKTKLGKAIHYLQTQWSYLITYLEDGRLEISNNRAERSIKPFVMARKNFLFSNTPRGAEGSAVMYSLIETAKEHNLDPYRYLVWVMSTAPTLSLTDPDWSTNLMPDKAPDDVKLNR